MPGQDRIPDFDEILDLAAVELETRARLVYSLPHPREGGGEDDWADAINDRAGALEALLNALYRALDAREAEERRRVG